MLCRDPLAKKVNNPGVDCDWVGGEPTLYISFWMVETKVDAEVI